MAAADTKGRSASSSRLRLVRMVLVGLIATLGFTFWTFGGVARACDPVTGEGCDMSPPPDEEDPPDTSPPATHPPATHAPTTHAPATQPPATHAPVTHAPATHAPVTVKGSTGTTVRQHTQTTRRSSSSGQQSSSTPEAPAESFLNVPVQPVVDPGVQLPAVQLAGDARAATGPGTAAEAGPPPAPDTSGGGDPKLALILAAAGVALLGAPVLTRKTCDDTTAASVRSQIAAACSEVENARNDIAGALTREASAVTAITQHHALVAASAEAHAGIDAIRGAARAALLGGSRASFALPGRAPVSPIDQLAEDMGTADFEATLARAHAAIDARAPAPDALAALEAAKHAAQADANAAEGRLAAANAHLQAVQAGWDTTCGPTPGCAG